MNPWSNKDCIELAYYPFGLVLGAISSRAVLKAKTPYSYNAGSEWEENGIEYYHTFFRKYDAQIGRFTGVDIASEEYAGLTPFQFGANNPVLFNDPFGDRLPTLNTNGDVGLDSHLQDLENDLSWERQSYIDSWGWMNEFGGPSGVIPITKWIDAVEILFFQGKLKIANTSINDIEREVKNWIFAGQYGNAARTIRDYFPEYFTANKTEYRFGGASFSIFGTTPERLSHGDYVVTLNQNFMDAWANGDAIESILGEKYVPNFADLVLSIYHEAQIHIAQQLKLPGYEQAGDELALSAAREIEAYSRMFTDKIASILKPSSGFFRAICAQFVYGVTTGFYKGNNRTSWELLTPTSKSKWAKQYVGMTLIVNGLNIMQ